MPETDLAAMLAGLKPLRGRLFLGEPPEDARVVPAETYLDPAHLADTIDRVARDLDVTERRVAASQWSKKYARAILAGPLGAMTLRGIGLHASLERAQIVVKKGMPQGIYLPDISDAVIYPPRFVPEAKLDSAHVVATRDDLYRAVLPAVFAGHYAIAVERARAAARLSKKILWGNAGNFCASFYDKLANRSECPDTIAADRDILLEAAESPLLPGERNPLRHPVRYDDLSAFGGSITRVRRTCCLSYRLPKAESCDSCPLLSREQRASAG